jgi:hypothetical protein
MTPMMTFCAGVGVTIAALYLLGFGVTAIALPSQASGYLERFATSARVHWLELTARLAAGIAFVGYASNMRFPGAFHLFGPVLVITTLGLAALPWRWHQRFAQTAVPAARPYLLGLGVVSIASAVLVFWAVASALPA